MYADQHHVFRRAFRVPVNSNISYLYAKTTSIIQADTTATASVV